ncbi:MAG: hypothetical protein AVDCRST_MAG58-357, partial [uncultured Rubrobacteraceae bacterium]
GSVPRRRARPQGLRILLLRPQRHDVHPAKDQLNGETLV